MRTLIVGSFLLMLAAPAPAAPPTGTIKGTIDKPEAVTAVFALERFSKKKYVGQVDTKTGQFTIPALPLDGKYDCIVDCGDVRLEGVNLKVPRSDYEEEQPLSKEDLAKLKEIIGDLNKFEDVIEVMTVQGNIQHAVVVLNKLRTKPFYESKPGEIIWRLEVWRFEKPEETWAKRQDELFAIHYRERMQKTVFDKKSLTLDPELGGLQLSEKQPVLDLGKVLLPEKKAGIKLRPGKPVVVEKPKDE